MGGHIGIYKIASRGGRLSMHRSISKDCWRPRASFTGHFLGAIRAYAIAPKYAIIWSGHGLESAQRLLSHDNMAPLLLTLKTSDRSVARTSLWSQKAIKLSLYCKDHTRDHFFRMTWRRFGCNSLRSLPNFNPSNRPSLMPVQNSSNRGYWSQPGCLACCQLNRCQGLWA